MERTTSRFTLVEMMVVIAIVMVLAAIAVPLVAEMQLRAKRAEVSPNFQGMIDATVAYFAATDKAPPMMGTALGGCTDNVGLPQLRTVINKKAVAWTNNAAFRAIAWAPDGAVRGSYCVHGHTSTNGAADLAAMVDVDNNDVALYGHILLPMPASGAGTSFQSALCLDPADIMNPIGGDCY